MKRLISLTIIALIAFEAIACSGIKQKNNNIMEKNNTKTVLVAYFSATGTTRAAARRLAKAADADLFEIVPMHLYSSEDLDWTNKKSRSTIEMNDRDSRPAIKDKVENWAQYKTIYIGFPIWWYTAPRIINTFMESYDFKGKTVIFFATSGGSNITKAWKDFSATYPDANWKEGKLLNSILDTELEKWVKSNEGRD